MSLATGPGVPSGLAVAACAGVVVGWSASCAVARLVGAPAAGIPGFRRQRGFVVAALAAVAVGLWWLEVVAGGREPFAAADLAPRVARWAGHVLFLAFLAAAAWIDLRERVIPDAITLPGVLAGLAWSGLMPRSLPPIDRLVPRSFAAPILEPDVLALHGPLGDVGLPAWLGSAPHVTGLAIAAVVFVTWWLACTAPAEPDGKGRRPFDPRLPVLAVGLAGIVAAWRHGGDHWPALLSALAGLAVGIAVVWMTRITASRALGREAVGFGDVTLVAVIGAWLGWQGVLIACCLGVLVGLFHGVVLYVLARDNELPFGPGLCAGALLVIVLWEPLWARFGPVFERPLEVATVAALVIGLTALVLAAWWRLRRAFPA